MIDSVCVLLIIVFYKIRDGNTIIQSYKLTKFKKIKSSDICRRKSVRYVS